MNRKVEKYNKQIYEKDNCEQVSRTRKTFIDILHDSDESGQTYFVYQYSLRYWSEGSIENDVMQKLILILLQCAYKQKLLYYLGQIIKFPQNAFRYLENISDLYMLDPGDTRTTEIFTFCIKKLEKMIRIIINVLFADLQK
jgi:hypothetical protein